jgi:CheY-like chemotaxis protein
MRKPSSNHREIAIGAGSDAVARPPPVEKIMTPWRAGSTNRFHPARSGMLRVLVVDDNRDAADTLAILVKRWGHAPRVAYDGATALIMAIDEPPDVVFLDIGMPEMDGFQLARQLRRQIRFTDTLLVAVTGWADQEHRRLWQEAFDCYLIKPVDPPLLENLLRDRAWLGRSRIAGQEADYNDRLGEALDEKPSRSLAAAHGAACLVEQ